MSMLGEWKTKHVPMRNEWRILIATEWNIQWAWGALGERMSGIQWAREARGKRMSNIREAFGEQANAGIGFDKAGGRTVWRIFG